MRILPEFTELSASGFPDFNQLEHTIFQPVADPSLKGHLHNLLPQIPHLLPPHVKQQCQRLLDTTIPKQTVSGAVLRTAPIKLFLKLLARRR